MTETLIVIPVYILVMLGTMQLSQNMMAGLLTTLSAFEAGRTAAVWIPEAESGRNGVSDDLVNDKVRIAAATVVTIAHLVVLYTPLAGAFHLVPLSASAWLQILPLGLVAILPIELWKFRSADRRG